MSKVKEVGVTFGLGATQEEAIANAIEVIEDKYVEPEWVGGLLKVYDQFPWVSKDEEETERILREEAYIYWSDENDFKEPIYNFNYHGDCYINPSNICSVQDGRIGDTEGCTYHYCEILMNSGQRFYLANSWYSSFRDKNEVNDEPSTTQGGGPTE